MGFDALLHALRGRFEDRANLHFVNLGIGDPQSHSAVPQHRIYFREQMDLLQHRLAADQERIVAVGRTVLHEALLQLAETLDIVARQLGIEEPQRVG